MSLKARMNLNLTEEWYMLVFFEGIVMCFILLIYCVVGIRNGAVGLVCLYEKDVQERVVKLGLVTKEQIKKQFLVSSIILFIPLFTLVPYLVYDMVNDMYDILERHDENRKSS